MGGIILGRNLSAAVGEGWIFLMISAALFGFSLLGGKRPSMNRGLMILLGFFFLGLSTSRDPAVAPVPAGMFYGRVCGEVKQGDNSLRTLIDRIQYYDGEHWNRVKGRASVFLETGIHSGILTGDCILGRGRLRAHREPMNPGQFDYGAFQRGQGILYRVYLDASSWSPCSNGYGRGMKIRALLFRRKLMRRLDSEVEGDTRILNALLL